MEVNRPTQLWKTYPESLTNNVDIEKEPKNQLTPKGILKRANSQTTTPAESANTLSPQMAGCSPTEGATPKKVTFSPDIIDPQERNLSLCDPLFLMKRQKLNAARTEVMCDKRESRRLRSRGADGATSIPFSDGSADESDENLEQFLGNLDIDIAPDSDSDIDQFEVQKIDPKRVDLLTQQLDTIKQSVINRIAALKLKQALTDKTELEHLMTKKMTIMRYRQSVVNGIEPEEDVDAYISNFKLD